MEFLIIFALIVFCLVCLSKATAPEPVHYDDTRQHKQAENKPLPLIEFKTNPRVIHTKDRYDIVRENDADATFFI